MSDIVERLKSWDRCYPGNINIEEAVDDAAAEITRLREENEKLRTEVMSDYHEGWEEGVKAERERCAKIAEQVRDDTCDGPVAWSMADGIASAIRENE
jgi:vacuolar-type H+-ATPase subunit H